MTNKIEIARELAEVFASPENYTATQAGVAMYELRELLDAPAVNRQEPVCYIVKDRWGVNAYLEESSEALKIRRRLGFTDEIPLYASPSELDLDAAAKKLAACMDYPWEHMPEQGRASMREHAKAVINAALNNHEGARS